MNTIELIRTSPDNSFMAYEYEETFEGNGVILNLWFDHDGQSVETLLTAMRGKYNLDSEYSNEETDTAANFTSFGDYIPRLHKLSGICNGIPVELTQSEDLSSWILSWN